jgi:RNA polymerase-binding transcription factor DksA
VRFPPELVARLRRALLRRGRAIATALAEVLADEKRAERAMNVLGIDNPGVKPEEALRKALDQVERRRVLLDADDDRYGRCDICGLDVGETALVQLPWADRCAEHRAI